MASKLYVGNLPFSASEEEIHELFSQYGDVVSANLVMDRETGRPRGFGFVEYNDEESANRAIEATNGMDFGGRTLTVNEARPRENRGFGGGGGGGRGGFGGGGGGRGGFGGGGGGGRGGYGGGGGGGGYGGGGRGGDRGGW